MQDAPKDLIKMIEGEPHLLNPADGKHYRVIDERKQLGAVMENLQKQPEELEFEKEFEKRRGLGFQSSEGPIPGGVGYGSFFTDKYKANYSTGTVIAVDIICPQKAGGNVSNWLYLTETNRTAKGVEALIYYLGQSELGFKVFDWARDNEHHWQLTISAQKLRNYLATKNIEGADYQVLSLQNQTFIVDTPQGKQWTNQMFLYNYSKECYSLVYSYEYEATEAEQKGAWVGSWGADCGNIPRQLQRDEPTRFFLYIYAGTGRT